ncbi:MAG: CotH kinase family protein [Muribaculaceae bacterium]|nr:CotH kinase family protein [Muribaculaceae bacterium]
MRVVIIDGCYAFEIYSPDAPDSAIDTILTPYTSNPASVLTSVVENPVNGTITLTMADGSEFTFNLDVAYPASVALLTDFLEIKADTGTATFEFRLNPSNIFFNFICSGEGCNTRLDLISASARTDAPSYVTEPSAYRITSVKPSVNSQGERKVGQYTATVECTDKDKAGEETVALVLRAKDGKGRDIEISSSVMSVAYGVAPRIHSIYVDGQAAEHSNDSKFYIIVPHDADRSQLTVTFDTGCEAIVDDLGNDIMRTGRIDLSTPRTLTASLHGMTAQYTLAACFSPLPVMYIDTPEEIESKEIWTDCSSLQLLHSDGYDAVYDGAKIRGRGNSTWYYPKKPYALKLGKKAEVLGMPGHKRWVLLANWLDRTLMRNDVALRIASRMQALEWTPRGTFVDVVVNGVFRGNYYLCEQIKADENRVNVGDGYLVEFDTNFDEVNKFHTAVYNLPVNIKSPDEDDIRDGQLEYITSYINRIEELLHDGEAAAEDVFDYLDMDSFIDWWLVHEVTCNGEPQHPKSSYMHKTEDGILKAGPVWDFDYGTFIPGIDKWLDNKSIWYSQLFARPEFKARVKERWAQCKPELESMPEYIDKVAAMLRESEAANAELWPITTVVNGDEKLSFEQAVERLKTCLANRIVWMDTRIAIL